MAPSEKNYDVFLTTFDNPFSPDPDSNEYQSWLNYDECIVCHNCNEKLADMCKQSESFSDLENEEAIEDAIDAIIAADFLGIYKKVVVPHTK